ncbi:MAG: hypothetical protein HY975_01285 [Candidatus Kerfeldbacteria bacterium]|nr:hypothetical protein [Candidatus Kerfeldbacteria bacterium]
MDLITHALLGAAIAPHEGLAGPMAISGIVPDLWTLPPLIEYLVRHRSRYRNEEFWKWIPGRYDELTWWSHSVVPLGLAASLGIASGVSPWLFLPWLLHLLIDIPTHASSRTGYLLYPFSRWQPLGRFNWYDRWGWSLLAIGGLSVIVVLRFIV